MSRRRTTLIAATIAGGAALALAGCSSSGSAQHMSSTAPMSGMSSTTAAAGTAGAHVGPLSIAGGYIPQPASPSVAAAYFTVTNNGSTPDVLTKVTTDVTSSVRAMSETDMGSTGTMTALPRVVVPAHGSFRFTQGHDHLMLEHPDQRLKQGDTVRMTITFKHAGTVSLRLPVVGFTGPSSPPMTTPSMTTPSMTTMSPSRMGGSGSGTTTS